MNTVSDEMRNTIICKAGELFGRYRYKKTTMDDIADALQKGKSSIYYYFQNKEDIFRAVIEKEAMEAKSALRKSMEKEPTPKDKLRVYLLERTKEFMQKANYYQALHSDYLTNLPFVEHLREKYDKDELQVIQQILDEGVEAGQFDVDDTYLTALIIVNTLKGIEIFFILDKLDISEYSGYLNRLTDILLYGITKR
jgi:AcrR family transcriptional regulator